MKKIQVFDMIGEGWNIFTKQIGLALGGFLLYMAIGIAGSVIPIVNMIYGIFIGPAIVGGFTLLFMNLAKEKHAEIGQLFEGFNRYGSLMGLYWLMALVVILCMVPSIIIVFLIAASGAFSFFGILLFILNIIVIIVLLVRYSFAYFVLMDNPQMGVFDALNESARIAKDHTGELILYFIVSMIIIAVSIMLLILPYFIAAPVLTLAFARIYLRLKEFGAEPSTPQPADMIPPASPEPPVMTPPEPTAPPEEMTPPEMPPPEDVKPPDDTPK
ncbi:MAG: DUF975 family protein [candidate division Zixibacteria bacterium]|nr:DUF975 family protein [candidate division Zixibacteria bacterium]